MKNNLSQQLSVLFIVFLLISLQQTATRAEASGQCAPSQKVGFNVAAQTRGAVVTLCGRYVAEQVSPVVPPRTTAHVSPNGKTKPSPRVSKPKVIDPQTALKLLHRKLARSGETSFTPTRLVVLVNPGATKPNLAVVVHLQHGRQYRTAFLAGRFVSLRFTPQTVAIHFDPKTRLIHLNTGAFIGKVKFLSTGFHAVRAIVTYRSEYRVTGSKDWTAISGNPQLVAVPAKVFVSKSGKPGDTPPARGKKPLLVANDCLQTMGLAGCLN